jgi:SAM-dependent methyltransferase
VTLQESLGVDQGGSDAPNGIASLYRGRGAALYHSIVRGDRSELREILHAVGREAGRVLELAAGSGRITLPLLRFADEVVAVDNSPELLDILVREAKMSRSATSPNRLTAMLGDILTVSLEGSFDVVVLGTTSISLFDEDQRRRLLTAVRDWLSPDGIFVISLRTVPLPAGGEAVHRVSENLRLVESVSEDGRRLTANLVETANDEPVGEYSVSTFVITSDELLAELAAVGLTVVSRSEVGSGSQTSEVGDYCVMVMKGSRV